MRFVTRRYWKSCNISQTFAEKSLGSPRLWSFGLPYAAIILRSEETGLFYYINTPLHAVFIYTLHEIA